MGKVTLRVTLKAEANEVGLHNVRIRLTKDRRSRYYALVFFVKPKQFNTNASRHLKNWIRGHDAATEYNDDILTAIKLCERAISTVEKSLDEATTVYSVDEVINQLRTGGNPESLSEYMLAYADRRMKLAGNDLSKIRTATNYHRSLRVWNKFIHDQKRAINIRAVSKKDIEDYKAWMQNRFPSETTTAGHLTHLKTVIKAAIAEGLITYEKDPMRGVKYAMKRKKVSRLSPTDIDKIEEYVHNAKVSGRTITPSRHARSLALAMYYLHGSRISDVITLRRRHFVVDDEEARVVYKAGKNKQVKSILLPEFVVTLLTPYLTHEDGRAKEAEEFLFPYLPAHFDKLTATDQVIAIRQANARAYNQIRRMGVSIGLTKNISPHLFRHSFADMLRREGVDLMTIQMVLGHADPRTTRDYMETLDQSAVDQVSSFFAKNRAASKTVGKQNLNNDGNTIFSEQTENA